MSNLTASTIATFLALPLEGEDLQVLGPVPLSSPEPHAVCFSKSSNLPAALGEAIPILLIGPLDLAHRLDGVSVIRSSQPRQTFAELLRRFFPTQSTPPGVHPTAIVAESASVHPTVSIGPYTVVESECVLGANTSVSSHVHLAERTMIGTDCFVGSNSVIGLAGYGFETDAHGNPFRIPHRGFVQIGNNVEVGSLVSIARGTLGPTIIHDHVKIDDHVFIAHNVVVHQAAMIIAGAEISGSVTIGEYAWIAPQSTIRNGISVGPHATVGIGAVVVKDVEANSIILGNPAKPR